MIGARGARALAGAALVLIAVTGCADPAPTIPTESADAVPVDVTTDITYTEVDGEPLALDVCTGVDVAEVTPVVLLIHGGGFEQGGKESMMPICIELAQNGIAGVTAEYRLLPAAPFPAQIEDVADAVRWIEDPANAERFGFDTEAIGALGSSAGAILAESLGTGIGGDDARVDAVVALSGATLFTPDALTLGEPTPEAEQIILAYLGCKSVEECPTAADASPLLHVDSSSAPTLFVSGSDEFVPVEHGEAMRDALITAGVDSEVLVEDGDDHGLSLLTAEARTAAFVFLSKHLTS